MKPPWLKRRHDEAPPQRDASRPPDPAEADTVGDNPAPPTSVPPPRRRRPQLPPAPTMGRIADNWRRRLADTTWPRPGFAADGGELGGFQVLAASVAGQKHLHEGSQRQDAYHFASLGEGAVLAVADGVSSQPLAAIGAEVAAFAAVKAYLEATWSAAGRQGEDEPLGERLALAVDRGEDAVYAAASELSIDPAELSTTLLIVDLRREVGGRVVVTAAGVGNSSAMAVAPRSAPAVIAGPPEGGSPREYHQFVPGAPGRAQGRQVVLPEGSALLLATDGFADDLHASPVLRDWLWECVEVASTPIEFGHLLSYRRQGTSDDLTAVLARPLPG